MSLKRVKASDEVLADLMRVEQLREEVVAYLKSQGVP